MALVSSNMMPLGTVAPDFTLQDVVSKQVVRLSKFYSDSATVIMFICNHCPYVKHIQDVLVDVAKQYGTKGVQFIAINANDPVNYPDDAPERMCAVAQEKHYPFPYLFDETQEVAKAYQAACTPDLFVFDKNLQCVYRGQFDPSRPHNGLPVTGESLTDALDCLLQGKSVNTAQQPSIGCSIKWRL